MSNMRRKLPTTASELSVVTGSPLFSSPIRVSQPLPIHAPTFHRLCDEALSRGTLSNNGPLVSSLESNFAEYLGTRNAIAVCNGTMGLMLAMKAMGLTGEIVAPAFTFSATFSSALWAGLKLVLCDIDPLTHQMSTQHIADCISENTSAILPVHLWGGTCPVSAIEAIAHQHGLRVIYDSAQALGSKYKKTLVGGFGDCEVFSLHATKIVSGCEGGIVSTNDDALALEIKALREFRSSGSTVGINGKMSEINAAFALASLQLIDTHLEENRSTFLKYSEHLSDLRGIQLIAPTQESQSNCHYVVIEVDEDLLKIRRDMVLSVLQMENIYAKAYFNSDSPMPHFTHSNNLSSGLAKYPAAEQAGQRTIALPCGPMISPNDIEAICQVLRIISSHSEDVSAKLTALLAKKTALFPVRHASYSESEFGGFHT